MCTVFFLENKSRVHVIYQLTYMDLLNKTLNDLALNILIDQIDFLTSTDHHSNFYSNIQVNIKDT